MNEQLPLFQLPPPADTARPRHVQIGSRIVPYALSVGGRRRLSMRIDERGLFVGAPRGVSLAEIDAFIKTHGQWVLDKLREFAVTQGRRQLRIHDGQQVPVLGSDVTVRVIAGTNRIRWRERSLELAARPGADLEALARRGLQRRALEVFGERLIHYAARLGREAPPLALSSARTRWGSCSQQTGVRLNWRLIHFPLHLIDYVVAHELAHLRQMNHSPRFWAVVDQLFPDWEAARQELKQRAPELPII